jgi:hypothetical protein
VVETSSTRIVRLVLLDAFIPENGQSVLDLIPPEVGAYFRDVAREHGDGWRLRGGESQLDLWRLKPGEHVISCARPCDFTLRCFEEPVRLLTNVACAWALRCFTGHSNCGSIRANHARVRASRRSSFFRLSPISRTLRRNSSFVARVFRGDQLAISKITCFYEIRGQIGSPTQKYFLEIPNIQAQTAEPFSFQ